MSISDQTGVNSLEEGDGGGSPRSLPLQAASTFGEANGLGKDVAEIRHKVIPAPWNPGRVRKGYLVALFQDRKVFDDFKAKCWPFGNTQEGARRCRRYLDEMEDYEDAIEAQCGSEDAIDDEGDDGFIREAHLRDYLAKNLGRIEQGLYLYNQGGKPGVEYPIDAGRIDILAVDKDGQLVVIELKVSRGTNKAVGQLLYYMGWVDKHLCKDGRCRGVIIAREIKDDLRLAVQRVQGVSLRRYILSVTVESA
jgi:hypothetical protein